MEDPNTVGRTEMKKFINGETLTNFFLFSISPKNYGDILGDYETLKEVREVQSTMKTKTIIIKATSKAIQ